MFISTEQQNGWENFYAEKGLKPTPPWQRVAYCVKYTIFKIYVEFR